MELDYFVSNKTNTSIWYKAIICLVLYVGLQKYDKCLYEPFFDLIKRKYYQNGDVWRL